MRPECKLPGSSGIVSLLAGVQSNTRLSCAQEMPANPQTSSAEKIESFLILQVLAWEMWPPREFQRRALRRYQGGCPTLRGFRRVGASNSAASGRFVTVTFRCGRKARVSG